MSSTQKLQTTADGDMWRYYPGVEVSDFYVNSNNTIKPSEKAQSGNELKFSVPISLGSSTSLNIPLGNFNFMGNTMLRITGTRGVNHSAKHVMLPGIQANKRSAAYDPPGGATAVTDFDYNSPTGNFLPMNGYELIDEVQIMLPGDEYYSMKGIDMFTYLMSQCESREKRESLWRVCRIDPAVDEAKVDEYPNTLLYGSVGKVADDAADLMGGISGRQELVSTDTVPFECILLMAFPWCSPNKDRRPKPFPTHKFGTQQATINITWKGAEHLSEAVSPAKIDSPKSQLVLKTCDLHFEYFNFANKSQLTSLESYTYPCPSIFPIEVQKGTLKALNEDTNPVQKYSCLVSGLRQGETSHLLITFMSTIGECMIPVSYELQLGGQILFKSVDLEGKLSEAFQLPYDDVNNKFFDERFKFIADARKYQGGDQLLLPVVAKGSLASIASNTTGTTGTPTATELQTSINLEKKAIEGIPVSCWTMIPFGKNTCSTNYHNYALGTRLDTTDVELYFTMPPYVDISTTPVSRKPAFINEVRIIQVMNGFWQFNGDKVKLFK